MKKSLVVLLVSFLLLSCNKDSNSQNPTINESVNPKEETEDNSGNPSETYQEIEDNVLYFSDGNSDLVSSDEDIVIGKYIFNQLGNTPEVTEGDIIVGDEGEGFLRKVESIMLNGNQMILETSQASLDDLFKDAAISFSSNDAEYSKGSARYEKTSYSKLAKGVTVSSKKNVIELGNVILKAEPGYSVTIKNGTIDFDVPIDFTADFNASDGLNELDFNVTNAKLGASYDIEFKFEGGSTFIEDKQPLFERTKTLSFLVGIIPVVIVVKSEAIAKFKVRNSSDITLRKHFDQAYSLSTRVSYSNGQWSDSYEHFLDSSSESPEINLVAGLELSLEYELKNDVKIYGVVGPYCTPELNFTGEFNVGVPTLDWDASVEVAADVKYGIELEIIKDSAALKYEKQYPIEKRLLWKVPHTFELVSGNNQKGNFGESLSKPLLVKVSDNYNNPFPFVPIHFEISEGGGSIAENVIKSNESGHSQALWTLGPQNSQKVSVYAKKGDGSIIEESSLTFLAEGNSTDSDEDNVDDDVDQCLETPSGEIVDSNGCSDSQKDSDGDGVSDSIDQCPNSPSGESVDSAGCIDNYDPEDESTWTITRQQVSNGVSGFAITHNGQGGLGGGLNFSLFIDGSAIGSGGYEGSWSYNGRLLTVNLSDEYESEIIEDGETVTFVCNRIASFSGSLDNNANPNFIQFVGQGELSVDCGSYGEDSVSGYAIAN